jgi:hypothetical protein
MNHWRVLWNLVCWYEYDNVNGGESGHLTEKLFYLRQMSTSVKCSVVNEDITLCF